MITEFIKKIRLRLLSCKNKNKTFTIFSSNCIGGVIASELHVQFNTPFVNLWLYPDDYIKFLKEPKKYLNYKLYFCKEKGIDYPIGILKDIKIYFYHYNDETEALKAWDRRKKRINFDNLYIIFTDRDGCTYKNLKEFDNLPYNNKVVFTNKKYPEFKSAYYISGFEDEKQVGNLVETEGKIIKKHIYERFNYVKWLNKNN